MITTIMRTIRSPLSHSATCLLRQSAATLPKAHLLHPNIRANTEHFPWCRRAKSLDSTHSIPSARQTLLGDKRPFFSMSTPFNWWRKKTCAGLCDRHYTNILNITSFPCKFVEPNSLPFDRINIDIDAMKSSSSVEGFRKFLENARKHGYRSFDLQMYSNYSASKDPYIITFSTLLDLLWVFPVNAGLIGDEYQMAICKEIPLDQKHIATILNGMLRFNRDYPFSLSLNKKGKDSEGEALYPE